MTDDDRIERSAGTLVEVGGLPARVGGGFRGKRDDQDEAVCEFARRLADEFPHEVQIRYNTNRLGGGAWLVDGKRDAQVGLGADLVPPQWHRDQFQEYLEDGKDGGLDRDKKPPRPSRMDPDELDLKFSVNVKVPAIPESLANRTSSIGDRSDYAYLRFDDLEEAWDWFIDNVNRDEVNPPG